jgi:hypothetical protein
VCSISVFLSETKKYDSTTMGMETATPTSMNFWEISRFLIRVTLLGRPLGERRHGAPAREHIRIRG